VDAIHAPLRGPSLLAIVAEPRHLVNSENKEGFNASLPLICFLSMMDDSHGLCLEEES
jgi:hypothetical protein